MMLMLTVVMLRVTYKRDECQALVDFAEVIMINPKQAEAYVDRGNAKGRLGKNIEALVDYDEAITVDSEYVNADVNRGIAKVEADKNNQALVDFDEAIRIESNNADA